MEPEMDGLELMFPLSDPEVETMQKTNTVILPEYKQYIIKK